MEKYHSYGLKFPQYTKLPLDTMSIVDHAREYLNTNLVEHQQERIQTESEQIKIDSA